MILSFLVPCLWLTADALRHRDSVEVFDFRQEVHNLADFNISANWDTNADSETVYGPDHRAAVLKGCGELCNFSIKGTPGKYFNEIRKHVDCEGLYSNTLNDAPANMWPPPQNIPASMFQDYTLDGTAAVEDWFFQDRFSGEKIPENRWTPEQVTEQMNLASKGQLPGTYDVGTTQKVYDFVQKHAHKINGKRLFVIGSQTPWVEAILLQLGAGHVTTIEYGRIRSEDPRITTKTPEEIRQQFLSSGGKEPAFDGGLTFSSIEHSGLGRYGDTLNPWGDIQAVAKAWCITKDSGLMFVGVPSREQDIVTWNAHRQYGPTRWSQLMANWRQLDRENGAEHPTYSPGTMYMFEKM